MRLGAAPLLERGLQPVPGPPPAPGAKEDLWVIPEPYMASSGP